MDLKWRIVCALFLPAALIYVVWGFYASGQDLAAIYGGHSKEDKFPRYYLSIVMVFGSVVTGSTHQGGASIAFPVMTMVLKTAPVVARDFAFLIQSVGMTSAALSIAILRVECHVQALIVCTIGGLIGLVLGLEGIFPKMSSPLLQTSFVAIFVSFAVSLYWWPCMKKSKREEGMELVSERSTDEMENPSWRSQAYVLFAASLVGGVLSALFGSGLGTCAYAALTIVLHVPDKVAIPTSVILMAVNMCLGALYRILVMHTVAGDAWTYFAVCVPVVVIGAPLGLVLAYHFGNSHMVAAVHGFHMLLVGCILAVIKPWCTENVDHPLRLCIVFVVLVLAGIAVCNGLKYVGKFFHKQKLRRVWRIDSRDEMSVGTVGL